MSNVRSFGSLLFLSVAAPVSSLSGLGGLFTQISLQVLAGRRRSGVQGGSVQLDKDTDRLGTKAARRADRQIVDKQITAPVGENGPCLSSPLLSCTAARLRVERSKAINTNTRTEA